MADIKTALVLALANAEEIIFEDKFKYEDEFMDDIVMHLIINRKRKREKVEGYVEVINSHTADDFKSHFRMYRHTMEGFVHLIANNMNLGATGRPQYDIRNQSLIFVWIMANQESYRSISDRFNVSRSTIFYILRRISGVLMSSASKIIMWPNEIRAEKSIQKFKVKTNFPGVIGAIDGTHVSILPPSANSASYVNRKGSPSMILQAVCDHKCRFIHCFTGYPGSVHDARVFTLSEISEYCTQEEKFPFNSHILGDAAYPLNLHLMTPFRDDGCLTGKQKKYNIKHAKTRVVIERAFGILKSRWRRLRYLEMRCSILIPRVILATCVLHNWCLFQNDEFEEDAIDDAAGLQTQAAGTPTQQKTLAFNKRTAIANEL